MTPTGIGVGMPRSGTVGGYRAACGPGVVSPTHVSSGPPSLIPCAGSYIECRSGLARGASMGATILVIGAPATLVALHS